MGDETALKKSQVEQLRPEMAKELFELVKGAPEQQILSLRSLDTKMVQVFQAATVVIGFLGLSSSTNLLGGGKWVLVPVVGALACYLYTVALAYKHLGPAEVSRNLEPYRWLSSSYKDLDDDGFRRLVIIDTGMAYSCNNGLLDKKAQYLHRALLSIGAEAFLVVVALLLSRLV